MSTDLQVTVRDDHEDLVVVTVAGALDFRTIATLRERATDAATGHRHLVLDMSRVTFCDSSGLNTLLRLLRHVRDNGATLTLTGVPAQTKRLLTITGADAVFTIRDNLGEALEALGGTEHRQPPPAPTA
ncbi:STAS domain-containing protein [Streptomyces sp. NPDC002701]|uniref:STAS domain-containing protein n=1 Tax=Streptomyces sp. NPDC002701 TaxID=3364661 RepID=UPI003688C05F